MTFLFNTFFSPAYGQDLGRLFLNTFQVSYYPLSLKGVGFDYADPFKFEFIFDTGSAPFKKADALNGQTKELIDSFFLGLTVPEKDLWVNLSYYEKDRILPDTINKTAIGKNFLDQDYLLKKITAALTMPDGPEGQRFWKNIYKKLYALYGTTKLPIEALNKVWIVPNEAEVLQYKNKVFVTKATLKVMMEEDYVALQQSQVTSDKSQESHQNTSHQTPDKQMDEGRPLATLSGLAGTKDEGRNEKERKALPQEKREEINKVSVQVMKEQILPLIEKEINTSKEFAPLRQLYGSIILAAAYKKRLKQSIHYVFVNQNKTGPQKQLNSQEKEEIYQQYIDLYKKGVFDYVRKDYDPYEHKDIKRRYVSGGVVWDGLERQILERLADKITVASSVIGRPVGKILKMGATLTTVAAKERGTMDDRSPSSLGRTERGPAETVEQNTGQENQRVPADPPQQESSSSLELAKAEALVQAILTNLRSTEFFNLTAGPRNLIERYRSLSADVTSALNVLDEHSLLDVEFFRREAEDDAERDHVKKYSLAAKNGRLDLIRIAQEFLRVYPPGRFSQKEVFYLGRSPSHLMGIVELLDPSRTYTHVAFSDRFKQLVEGQIVDYKEDNVAADPFSSVSRNRLQAYHAYLLSLGFDPASIINRYKQTGQKTILVEYVESGDGLASFLSLLLSWAREQGMDKALQESLRLHILEGDQFREIRNEEGFENIAGFETAYHDVGDELLGHMSDRYALGEYYPLIEWDNQKVENKKIRIGFTAALVRLMLVHDLMKEGLLSASSAIKSKASFTNKEVTAAVKKALQYYPEFKSKPYKEMLTDFIRLTTPEKFDEAMESHNEGLRYPLRSIFANWHYYFLLGDFVQAVTPAQFGAMFVKDPRAVDDFLREVFDPAQQSKYGLFLAHIYPGDFAEAFERNPGETLAALMRLKQFRGEEKYAYTDVINEMSVEKFSEKFSKNPITAVNQLELAVAWYTQGEMNKYRQMLYKAFGYKQDTDSLRWSMSRRLPLDNPNRVYLENIVERLRMFVSEEPETARAILSVEGFKVRIIGGVADPWRNKILRKDADIYFDISEISPLSEAHELLLTLKSFFDPVGQGYRLEGWSDDFIARPPLLDITGVVKEALREEIEKTRAINQENKDAAPSLKVKPAPRRYWPVAIQRIKAIEGQLRAGDDGLIGRIKKGLEPGISVVSEEGFTRVFALESYPGVVFKIFSGTETYQARLKLFEQLVEHFKTQGVLEKQEKVGAFTLRKLPYFIPTLFVDGVVVEQEGVLLDSLGDEEYDREYDAYKNAVTGLEDALHTYGVVWEDANVQNIARVNDRYAIVDIENLTLDAVSSSSIDARPAENDLPIIDLYGKEIPKGIRNNYLGMQSTGPFFQIVHQYKKDYLSLMTDTPHILIIGGSAEEVAFLWEIYPRAVITVVNLHVPYLRQIKEKYEKQPGIGSRLHLYRADASALAHDVFPSASFDVIFSQGVEDSTYFGDTLVDKMLEGIVLEERRLIRPGGYIYHFGLDKKYYQEALVEGELQEVFSNSAGYVYFLKAPAARSSSSMQAHEQTNKPVRIVHAAYDEFVLDTGGMFFLTFAKYDFAQPSHWRALDRIYAFIGGILNAFPLEYRDRGNGMIVSEWELMFIELLSNAVDAVTTRYDYRLYPDAFTYDYAPVVYTVFSRSGDLMVIDFLDNGAGDLFTLQQGKIKDASRYLGWSGNGLPFVKSRRFVESIEKNFAKGGVGESSVRVTIPLVENFVLKVSEREKNSSEHDKDEKASSSSLSIRQQIEQSSLMPVAEGNNTFITYRHPTLPVAVKVPRYKEAADSLPEEMDRVLDHMGGILSPTDIYKNILIDGVRQKIVAVQPLLHVFNDDPRLPKTFTLPSGETVDLWEKEKTLITRLYERGIEYHDALIPKNYGLDLDTGDLYLVDHGSADPEGSFFTKEADRWHWDRIGVPPDSTLRQLWGSTRGEYPVESVEEYFKKAKTQASSSVKHVEREKELVEASNALTDRLLDDFGIENVSEHQALRSNILYFVYQLQYGLDAILSEKDYVFILHMLALEDVLRDLQPSLAAAGGPKTFSEERETMIEVQSEVLRQILQWLKTQAYKTYFNKSLYRLFDVFNEAALIETFFRKMHAHLTASYTDKESLDNLTLATVELQRGRQHVREKYADKFIQEPLDDNLFLYGSARYAFGIGDLDVGIKNREWSGGRVSEKIYDSDIVDLYLWAADPDESAIALPKQVWADGSILFTFLAGVQQIQRVLVSEGIPISSRQLGILAEKVFIRHQTISETDLRDRESEWMPAADRKRVIERLNHELTADAAAQLKDAYTDGMQRLDGIRRWREVFGRKRIPASGLMAQQKEKLLESIADSPFSRVYSGIRFSQRSSSSAVESERRLQWEDIIDQSLELRLESFTDPTHRGPNVDKLLRFTDGVFDLFNKLPLIKPSDRQYGMLWTRLHEAIPRFTPERLLIEYNRSYFVGKTGIYMRLDHVLREIIVNAYDALIPPGNGDTNGAVIPQDHIHRVKLLFNKELVDGEEYLVISIEDDGLGNKAASTEVKKAKKSTKEYIGGRGVGLRVVNAMVSLAGGNFMLNKADRSAGYSPDQKTLAVLKIPMASISNTYLSDERKPMQTKIELSGEELKKMHEVFLTTFEKDPALPASSAVTREPTPAQQTPATSEDIGGIDLSSVEEKVTTRELEGLDCYETRIAPFLPMIGDLRVFEGYRISIDFVEIVDMQTMLTG